MQHQNKIPTCYEYSILLQKAIFKFKITIEQARKKYGQFSQKEWHDLLNS